MISTTDISLRVRLLAAVATTQCPITGHYVTMTEAGIVTGVNPIHTVTNNTTAITVVPTVPSGVGVLKNLQVVNQDTANINVIVEQYSLSTGVAREMSSTPLGVGQYLMIDAAGTHSVSAVSLVGSGTVTQVQGNGTVNGITLTGNVTTSGNLTLGGTLSGSAPSLTAGNVTNIPNLSGVITGNSTGTTTLTANGTNSAGVAGWVSDETGTGSLVFSTNATMVTPNLGTPSVVNLTNAVGLPLTTGVTGVLPVANGGTGESTATGWIALGACTYETADSPTFQFSIAADVTGFIGVGNRIKLTQTTVKYFLVTAVGAYSGGKTIITVYGGTDYTLANAAITSPFFSIQKCPFGFPLAKEKWTITVTDTALRAQASPVQNTWYNLGGLSITVHIGLWDLGYSVCLYSTASSVATNMQATLSTTNNSETDSGLTVFHYLGTPSTTNTLLTTVSSDNNKSVSVAAKTTMYLNARTTITSQSSINFDGADSKTIIKAVSAYL